MTDRPWHILFAESFDPSAMEQMRAVARVSILDRCDEKTLSQAVPDCDALLVRSLAQVTGKVLERATRLRVIGRGGVGVDNIDLEVAKERGIRVVYTPAASTDAVADLTVGLMIAVVRGIARGDVMVRSGQFAKGRETLLGRELGGLTLGIVGLGRIGRAVARRCAAGFGMRILYNDIVDPGPLDFEAEEVTKEELYRRSDIVTLHVPLTPLTRGLIDERALALFGEGSILLNTSRGAVVDSEALAGGLVRGVLGGAGLDVFDPEPLPAGHPLLTAPNTVFTPHLGARSPAALARMNVVVEDVIRVLQGETPMYPAWA
ncbi:MAG: hydroxyacid dehydrogenase [Planctomycetes bacterium]|nr:hydroxyacid dehydrogenase [Planctomycetota bacterium]